MYVALLFGGGNATAEIIAVLLGPKSPMGGYKCLRMGGYKCLSYLISERFSNCLFIETAVVCKFLKYHKISNSKPAIGGETAVVGADCGG